MNFLSSLLGDEREHVPKDEISLKEPGKPDMQGPGEITEESKFEEAKTSSQEGGVFTFFTTLAKKSEEVLSTYQRDLAEFGKELKKETEHVAKATTTALPELPHMLETGAHKTQEKIDALGHQVEELGSSLWKGTTEIFQHVKEAVKFEHEEGSKGKKASNVPSTFTSTALTRGKYSRYEAQVTAMQRDSSTYCDEPEDVEDYAAWRQTFSLESRKGDIEAIVKENAFMQELQSRIVPLIVEHEAFWTRYFYRLHKLQVAEDARADLVKRASVSEEEELSWDVDEPETSPKAHPAKEQEATESAQQQEVTPSQETKEESSVTEVKEAESEVPATTEEGPSKAPAAGRKSSSEQDDDGLVSDGSLVSTGSDWCVVEKGKEGNSSSDVSPKVAAAEAAARAAAEVAARAVATAVVSGESPAELPEAEQTAIPKEEEGEAAIQKVASEAAPAGTKEAKHNKGGGEEDWGTWE